jgi:hypothetical protein
MGLIVARVEDGVPREVVRAKKATTARKTIKPARMLNSVNHRFD